MNNDLVVIEQAEEPESDNASQQVKRSTADTLELAQQDALSLFRAAIDAYRNGGPMPPAHMLKAIEVRAQLIDSVELSHRPGTAPPALLIHLPKEESTGADTVAEILARYIVDVTNDFSKGLISASQKREFAVLPMKLLETIPKVAAQNILSIDEFGNKERGVLEPGPGGFTRSSLDEKLAEHLASYGAYKKRAEKTIEYLSIMVLKSEKDLTEQTLKDSLEEYLVKKGAA